MELIKMIKINILLYKTQEWKKQRNAVKVRIIIENNEKNLEQEYGFRNAYNASRVWQIGNSPKHVVFECQMEHWKNEIQKT